MIICIFIVIFVRCAEPAPNVISSVVRIIILRISSTRYLLDGSSHWGVSHPRCKIPWVDRGQRSTVLIRQLRGESNNRLQFSTRFVRDHNPRFFIVCNSKFCPPEEAVCFSHSSTETLGTYAPSRNQNTLLLFALIE